MDASKSRKVMNSEKVEDTLAEQAQRNFGQLEHRAGPIGCHGTYRIGLIDLILKYFGTSRTEIAKSE